MTIRRTPITVAALLGTAVLAWPAMAGAAVPFSVQGDQDDSSQVPDTIDSSLLTASRTQAAYTFTVSYDALAKTPVTQRLVAIIDQPRSQNASSIRKGNLLEVRTNRKNAVSVHFYNATLNLDTFTATIKETTCRGLSVVPKYDSGSSIRYTMPRSCYFGNDNVKQVGVTATDYLFTDATWDPAATLRSSNSQPDSEASDNVSGSWVFNPDVS